MNNESYCGSSDEALAALRKRLTGEDVVSAFLTNGESVVVKGANLDTLSYFQQDGIFYLRVQTGPRTWVIPNVQYWTED